MAILLSTANSVLPLKAFAVAHLQLVNFTNVLKVSLLNLSYIFLLYILIRHKSFISSVPGLSVYTPPYIHIPNPPSLHCLCISTLPAKLQPVTITFGGSSTIHYTNILRHCHGFCSQCAY